jgi:undecaprenyl-diphosphatase
VYEFDKGITLLINGWAGHNSLADTLAVWGADDLIFVMVAVVALRWWQIGSYPRMRHVCLVAGLSFLLAVVINLLVTLFIHRVRPNDAGLTQALIAHSPDWSFPSDHAATSTAIAAALWFQDHRKLATALFVAVAIICVSRVFVGVHYVSDVIGGALVGIAAAYVVSKLFHEDNRLSRQLVGIF